MRKENSHTWLTLFALVSALVVSAAGNAAALDSESRTVFTAPVKGDEEASVRNAEPAQHLGTFTIPSSQGRITFFDETPLAKTPSISIIVVENSWFSTLAEAKHRGTSALDLFMEFAPPRTKIPERLKLYADLLRTGDVPGSAEAKTTSALHLHGPSNRPDVSEDDWGDGNCDVKEDWDAGFANWVSSFQFGFWDFGSSSEEITIHHGEIVHGYLGFNDAIWVGVCVVGALKGPSDQTVVLTWHDGVGWVEEEAEIEPFMYAAIQYQDSNGDWEYVGRYEGSGVIPFGPTYSRILPSQRYLYHSYKPYTMQRRVIVTSTFDPEGNYLTGNTAFISARWKDNFTPDSTKATP